MKSGALHLEAADFSLSYLVVASQVVVVYTLLHAMCMN